ncbi:MAG: hypothetical protein AMXMBFR67_19940 [Nitrospira sp.]
MFRLVIMEGQDFRGFSVAHPPLDASAISPDAGYDIPDYGSVGASTEYFWQDYESAFSNEKEPNKIEPVFA